MEMKNMGMENEIRQKMRNKERVLGTFLELGSTSVVECLALSGYDYVIIDTEHGPFETESVMEFVCAANRRHMTPFVRVKEVSRAAILKNLDVGAMGLILPNVHTADEVRQAVKFGKYYPIGERGVAFGRGCGYGAQKEQSMEDYFAEANRETMLIPQCETIGCLEQIEEIVNISGVDGIFIGPYDLSTAMGKPGKLEETEILEAFERIQKACRAAGKPCMIYADSAARAREYFAQGYDSVTLSMDALLLIDSMKEIVKSARRCENEVYCK